VRQVGYLKRVYRDARSTEHKIMEIPLHMRVKIFTCIFCVISYTRQFLFQQENFQFIINAKLQRLRLTCKALKDSVRTAQ
jgi:uncharacterized membrane protein